MNRTLKKYNYLNRTTDICVLWFVWAVSYILKFEFGIGGENSGAPIQRYIGYGVLLTLTSLIVFKNLKLYDSLATSFTKDVLKIVKANALSFAIFLVLSFFSSQDRLSRVVLVLYFTFSTFFLIFVKIYFRNQMKKIPIRLILVGDGSATVEYFNMIKDQPQYKVVNWFNAPETMDSLFSNIDFSSKAFENEKCDGVILGFDTMKANLMDDYLGELSNSLIPIMILPDISYAKLGFSFSNFRGIPVIHINEPNTNTLGLVLKRAFDIFSCGLGLLVISPLLLFLSLLVKVTSKGPIFYAQIRMGVDGREFKMWKFRSMIVGEANQEGWTVKNDPRVTKIGNFMRKTSFDELPQLWNVVIGDMSLVGPRPERPVYVNKFRDEIPSYMLRHKFKAGITGWAQVNGWRGDTSIEKRIECDLWYIKNWSLGLDISIIFLTFWKGFINKNAY